MKRLAILSLIVFGGLNTGLLAQSIPVENNNYHYYGPNSSWGEYLKVGGNGRGTTKASVVSTNGNLHLDSKDGNATYINHYSKGNTYLNPQGGIVGIGTSSPQNPLHIVSSTHHHQLKLQGTNGKHSWIQFYPNGSNMINWQIGANTNGFSIYDVSNSKYNLTVDNSGNIGIGISNPSSKLQLMNGNNGISFEATESWEGLGFNRSAKNGQILNITKSAWQFTARDERFSLEGYNGASNNLLNILKNGNIGIGTKSPDMKLTVKGNIHAEEVKIDLNVPAPDYVFKKNYDLRTIEEVEKFIKENSHLPEIPSAKEFEQNGVMQAEMDMNLLKKIEELTLYTIQQQKEIESLKKENKEVKLFNTKLLELQSRLEKLESEK